MSTTRLIATLAFLLVLVGCKVQETPNSVNQPLPNPYLSAPIYGVTHFNPAQTDAFPYAVPAGNFKTDLSQCPVAWGGPVNLMCLAATDTNHMWAISTEGVSYMDASGGNWKKIAFLQLPGVIPVGEEKLKTLVHSKFTNVEELTRLCVGVLGDTLLNVTSNGIYTVADKDNNVYVNVGTTICVIGLKDNSNPASGLALKRSIDGKDVFKPLSILGMPPVVRLIGMNMTYDGRIVIGCYNAIAVIDREFKEKPVVYNLEEGQLITNSLTIDSKNGIYVVSGSLAPKGNGVLRKLVWNGTSISDKEDDGAWKSDYPGGDWPPAIKAGTGSGATPTLMGFNDREDKLVVITDGTNRMNIIAFWRDEIPADAKQVPGALSNRIAGMMPVTAGLDPNTPWIQSEQSVVVNGWGAFVVNNIIPDGLPDKIVDVMAIGPLLSPPKGMEKFQWDPEANKWSSAWYRNDVVSTSMVPSVSMVSKQVFVNGYSANEGWEVTGLDWNTGQTVYRNIFGHNNQGNGAYAIIQYLSNGDLLFNSISGPIRIPHKK